MQPDGVGRTRAIETAAGIPKFIVVCHNSALFFEAQALSP